MHLKKRLFKLFVFIALENNIEIKKIVSNKIYGMDLLKITNNWVLLLRLLVFLGRQPLPMNSEWFD